MSEGTKDSLLGGQVALWQPADGYRVAIDTVLLAAAVRVRPGAKVLELGSGVGGASLCVANRVADCQIIGLDMAEELVAVAQRNAAANGVGDRVSFQLGDVCAVPADIADGKFDHVLANPPFLEAARSRPSPDPARAAAFVEASGDALGDWLASMIRLARSKGQVTLIHRADRLDHILAKFAGQVGDIIVYPLWPKAGQAAKRVIVTGRVGARGALTLAAGLVLHRADGRYTEAAEAILRHGRALALVD
ncbi:MAG: tRNA1(Val) (adenine(37)-N6)-methyltransferase [Alphaproteobacteria bacterium]